MLFRSPPGEVYAKAGALLEEKYGLYEGFEKVVREGAEVLTKLGAPEDLAKAFFEVGGERIHVKLVKVKGVLEIRCLKPNGVKLIKDAFLNVQNVEKAEGTTVQFAVIAAPRYSVEVAAANWERAEEVLQQGADSGVDNNT